MTSFFLIAAIAANKKQITDPKLQRLRHENTIHNREGHFIAFGHYATTTTTPVRNDEQPVTFSCVDTTPTSLKPTPEANYLALCSDINITDGSQTVNLTVGLYEE